ncbi:Wzz/FepE/Etk N-terminal domain-containing protein [Homoserinimonas sp. A520]
MESLGYLEIFRQRWLAIVSAVVLGLGTAAIIAFSIPPTYTATATMFLSVQDSSATLAERSEFSQDRVASYPDLVHSEGVLRPTINQLGLDVTLEQLKTMVSAENPDSTVLVNVSAQADDPDTAATIANAAASNLAEVVADIEKSNVLLDQRISATAPPTPSAPQKTVIIGLGLVAGLALGAVAALLLTRFDRRLRNIADVRRASGLPVLGAIPVRRPPRRHENVEPLVPAAMADALLTIRQANGGGMPRLLLLVPAGKRATPARIRLGLAHAAASTGRDVLLVETERSTDTTELAAVRQAAGLAELLEGTSTLAESAVAFESHGIRVLPAGTAVITGNRAEASLRTVVGSLVSDSDVVIAQSTQTSHPASLPLLGPYADVAVVVARHARSTDGDLARAISQLRIVGVRPIGVVLFDVPRGRHIDLPATWRPEDFRAKPAKALIGVRRKPAPTAATTTAPALLEADDLDAGHLDGDQLNTADLNAADPDPKPGTEPSTLPEVTEEQVVQG